MQKKHFKLRAVKTMQLFCLMLSLALLCTMMPVGVQADEVDMAIGGDLINEEDESNELIEEAVDEAVDEAVEEAVEQVMLFAELAAFGFEDGSVSTEAELRAAVGSVPAGGAATITLLEPISLTGTTLVIPASRSITLVSDPAPITLSGADGKDTVSVEGQATLTIDGVNVTHNAGGTGRGVSVSTGGGLILESGKITGNSGNLGGGVYNLGRFVMNGGEISGNSAGNSGGGIRNEGTFELTGGVIKLNSAAWFGGGVYNHDKASFIMTGGEISNNQAPEGGGVYNAIGGKFTLTDGYIQGNAATGALGVSAGVGGGVYNGSENTYFTMEGGVISGNSAKGSGAGVVNKGVFLMTDGAISGNTVTNEKEDSYGGGVWNTVNGAFTMTGGEITGNEARNGGGVANYMGAGSYMPVFTMEGGGILGNAGVLGGGVYNNRSAIITKGSISGNSAYDGGGVYNAGVLSVKDGVFHLNAAVNDGGGIWAAYQNLDKVSVGQEAVFTENSACLSCGRNPIDDALYAAQILCTKWTYPLTQGYNNYDISYRYDPGEELLTIVQDVTVTTINTKVVDLWRGEKTPYQTVTQYAASSNGSVTATTPAQLALKELIINPKNGNLDNKDPLFNNLVVKNANHFTFAKLPVAELAEGVGLVLVVGNKIDKVGTGKAFINADGKLELVFNGSINSSKFGAVAFTNLLEPKNGNIHSDKVFSHDNKSVINLPPADKDGYIYLYVHFDSLKYNAYTEKSEIVWKVTKEPEVVATKTFLERVEEELEIIVEVFDENGNPVAGHLWGNPAPGRYTVVFHDPFLPEPVKKVVDVAPGKPVTVEYAAEYEVPGVNTVKNILLPFIENELVIQPIK